ncbi:MAG: HD domain-containing phosphohydrolase [Vicinamibacterales bacterium]
MTAAHVASANRLYTYVGAVGALGAVVLGQSLRALPSTPEPIAWTGLSLLVLLAGAFGLKVPGSSIRLSVSDTFLMTIAMLFGPAPATIAIGLDGLLISLVNPNVRAPRRVVFNLTAPALGLWAGSMAFTLLMPGGSPASAVTSPLTLVLPLACLVSVYFLINSGSTAIAVALERGQSAFDTWRRHFAALALNYVAAACAAFFLVVIIHRVGFIVLAAVIPLVIALQVAMRSWVGRLEDAERHVTTVDRLYLSTISALSTAIEAKDGVTSSHIHRVQHYAMGLAQALGVSDPMELKALEAAALLHDTGKLAVPERILNKPGRLTPAEFETMKRHVDVGADILSTIEFPYPVVPIVRAHHENWDGSGYPRGTSGEDIPLGARILTVVDCYDALTSDRPYRPALSDEEAMRIIMSMRGTKYDPRVVDVFARVRMEIAPSACVEHSLRDAVQPIRSAAQAEQQPEASVPAAPPAAGGFDGMLELVSLARVVGGRATAADVAALAWSHIGPSMPGASCALFMVDPTDDAVVVAFVAGETVSLLQGVRMSLGERLSGWVADHGQAIANSDAKLDLGEEASVAGLHRSLAVPLSHKGRVIGVWTCYQADTFSDAQSASLERAAPLVAQMLASLVAPAAVAADAAVTARKSSLRVVARQ